MKFMNEHDIADVVDRFAKADDLPNLRYAVVTLARLARWTNRNSDGWAYWPKPVNAARRLIERVEQAVNEDSRYGVEHDLTNAELTAILRPIKAFRTRQGADFEIVEAA